MPDLDVIYGDGITMVFEQAIGTGTVKPETALASFDMDPGDVDKFVHATQQRLGCADLDEDGIRAAFDDEFATVADLAMAIENRDPL